jgi:hypothetical protein
VVRDATVVVCKMFFAGAVWVGFFGDPPQPTRAREKALAPIPITLLMRFIAVSFRTDDDIRQQSAKTVYFADLDCQKSGGNVASDVADFAASTRRVSGPAGVPLIPKATEISSASPPSSVRATLAMDAAPAADPDVLLTSAIRSLFVAIRVPAPLSGMHAR